MSKMVMRALFMSEISSQFAITVSPLAIMPLNKTDNIRVNVTLRCVRKTTAAVEKP
jgi:hypothetical protein